jgi:hypothetical protein
MLCERKYNRVSDLFEHAKQYNPALTSVMESPIDGTLTLFFSNRGSVADTKPLVCWRAEVAPSCEVHRPAERAFRMNNRCRCSDDDILELLATTIKTNDLVKRSAIVLVKIQTSAFLLCSGGTGRSLMGRRQMDALNFSFAFSSAGIYSPAFILLYRELQNIF